MFSLPFLFQSFDSCKLYEDRYLVAFSGGPDSVFLLESLSHYYQNDLNKHIALCYINYQDSPFVKEEEAIIDFYTNKYQLTTYKALTSFNKKKDRNFEDWARKYRYHFFAKLVKKENYRALLTAHQKDDVLETYLLQKERGNLPLSYGLSTTSSLKNLLVIRPLLSVSKKEIYNYLHENNLPYYEDITNKDDHTLRNKIRRKERSEEEEKALLLEIEERNTKLKAFYEELSSLSYPLSFKKYKAYDAEEKKRLLYYLLEKENIQENSKRKNGLVKEAYEFLKRMENGSLVLDKKKVLYRTKEGFFIDKDRSCLSYQHVFKRKQVYKTEIFTIDLKDPSLFNLQSLPVIVRNYKEGDQISTNLPQKDVKTFLKKQGVPFSLLPLYPVFLQNGKIVAVPFYSDIKKGKLPLTFNLPY